MLAENVVWFFQNQITKYFSEEINQRLHDCLIQEIKDSCSNSNKGRNYIVLKEDWQPEQYFKLLNHKEALTLFKYRTSNHRLPIETGRFFSVEYKDRICQKCHNDIGDEFHYLLKCPFLTCNVNDS